MFNRIKAELANYFSADVQKQVKPESYAETGGGPASLFKSPARNKQEIENYAKIYECGGMISEAVDLYPLFMFSKGYSWEGEKGAMQACSDFMEGFDYELAFNMGVTAPLVCANGYQEILEGRGGDILGLLYQNPVSFDTVYDEHGLVTGYTQTVTNKIAFNTVIKFEEPQIFHTQMIPSIRDRSGISLIQRAKDEIMRDITIAQDSANAIHRHGTPKWWARVGKEGENVSDDVLNAICRKLEELNSKNDIATPYDVAIQALDTDGVVNIQAYQDSSLVRLTAAMGVPGELLGFRQGTTDNTAVSRIGAFLQKCSTYQNRFARQLNIQVFDQVTGVPGSAKIKFNSILPSQQAEMAGWIVNLIKANPLDPEAYCPTEWVKQTLNIPDKIEET